MIRSLDSDFKKREDEIIAHKSKVIKISLLLLSSSMNILLNYSEHSPVSELTPASAEARARISAVCSMGRAA